MRNPASPPTARRQWRLRSAQTPRVPQAATGVAARRARSAPPASPTRARVTPAATRFGLLRITTALHRSAVESSIFNPPSALRCRGPGIRTTASSTSRTWRASPRLTAPSSPSTPPLTSCACTRPPARAPAQPPRRASAQMRSPRLLRAAADRLRRSPAAPRATRATAGRPMPRPRCFGPQRRPRSIVSATCTCATRATSLFAS